MNISQKQTILNSIELILSFDFDNLISENNPSGNIDEIKYGDYSASDFRNTYLKVFSQLKAELEEGLGLMLPNQDVFSNEFSQVVLDVESGHFFTHLQNFASRSEAAEVLKRFVYYQIREGFWNKSSVMQHSVDSEKLNAAQENLILVQKNLSKNIGVFEKLKTDFETHIQNFSAILTEKKTESVEIAAFFEKAKIESEGISALLLTATNKDIEISSLIASIKVKLETVAENINVYKESFNQIETANKVLSEDLKKDLEGAKINLKDSKEGNEYIQNQKAEVIRLIGMAADGTLGYKFDSRKEALEKGVKDFWRWAVPGSILIALSWVVIVFTCLSAHLDNEWINLIINLIKTSPAWLLVGFIFSQYSKERNLQEEYAFKSAIAMTLTAYSQMLSEIDGGETKVKSSKQEMLLKSIKNLYTQPILKADKTDKSESINLKQLMESLKSLTGIVKNIKE